MAIRVVILNVLLLCQIYNIMSKHSYFQRAVLILAFVMSYFSTMNAQWVSPGNGTTYTMSDLVTISNGVVTNTGTVFSVNNDLTISQNDVLKIDNQVSRIDAGNVLITIQGSMVCSNIERVKLYGTMTEHFSMRFENATNCQLKTMYFSDGAGIKVIESEVDFIDCKFVYFTRDYCNAANGQGSPKILNCQFDSNVDGINSPQINLGPGAEDTIYIVGNEIDGTYATYHAGGISVADLMGTGSTKVLIENNVVKENRYGYNQQGQTISSVIRGNRFVNNNHEDNPMNGGSGISIYGSSTNCKAKLRNNTITGNLWGITAIYFHDIDLGTEDDWGYNQIYDNGNEGVLYELYNNSACDIMAVGNAWGTTDENEVEERIVHQKDDPSLGLVTYIPFIGYDAVNEVEMTGFEVSPNPVSNGTITLTLDEEMPSEVVIYSLQRQIIKSQHIDNKVNTINLDALKSGIYIVEVKNANKTMVKRVFVE